MTVTVETLVNYALDRRALLRRAGAIGGTAAVARLLGVPVARAQEEGPTLVTQIRSLANEYHAIWAKGGDNFAASVDLEDKHQVQTTEGDSQKGIASIRSALAASGQDTVVNVDPNDAPDALPMVESVEEAQGWIVTHWNKPADLHPREFEHYVAHIAADGVAAGRLVAIELFEAMGGSGGFVAVQGILDNVPAQQRFQGLQIALQDYPDITLLEVQPANWDQTLALNTMDSWLTKYGDEITGVWAANDGMGLGCLEALRAQGKAGAVPVVGVDGTSQAVQAVIDGEFAATMANDPFLQGGLGLSLGYHAWTGELVPSNEPPEHREFFYKTILVTPENAQAHLETVAVGNVDYDWNDLWFAVAGGSDTTATPTA